MQSSPFGWHSDGVGALALIGAASAICAPFVGGFADRKGPRRSLLVALSTTLLAWGLLAAFGDAVAGVIVGMIVLDLGATGADISNRTIIFSLRPEIRTRLATIYMFGKFAGAGAMAWLAGLVDRRLVRSLCTRLTFGGDGGSGGMGRCRKDCKLAQRGSTCGRRAHRAIALLAVAP
jgi:MFS family permease